MKRGKKRHLRDYFLPHHGNKHTPHLLGHGALLSYSVGLVLIKFCLLAAGVALPGATLYSSAITSGNIITLTNQTRDALRLTPLTENSLLDVSAQKKANDMLKEQYFAHTSPEGMTPWSWIRGAGYSYKYAGENLAVYYTQAEDVTEGWLASPTHRANIVDERYSDIGVGVAQGTYNGFPAIFVVQHFGTPAEVSVPSEISEEEQATQTVSVTPSEAGYDVIVKNPDATSMSAQLNTTTVALHETVAGEWSGSIPAQANEIPTSGQELLIIAATAHAQDVEPAVLVAPGSSTAEMYAFEEPNNQPSFWGISFGALDDGVTKIYLITIAALGTLLALTLLAKMHWERLPLAAHTLAVMGIAAILLVI